MAALDWSLHMALAPGKALDLAKQCATASSETAQSIQFVHATQWRAARMCDDPRFCDDAWSRWPYWLYRDAFLQTQKWWEAATTATPGVERHHEELVRFLARQLLDACSPSNCIVTNPAVRTAAWRTGGLNFVTGMQHWFEEYLTRLFLNNDLAGGRYCVDGRPVALSDIEAPTFVVGTERDHVSPWRSVYKLHLLTHHPLTFLLTAGGHNAGIVSEPGHAGRYYRCVTRERGAPYRSRHDLLAQTAPVEGSWWLR